MRENLIKYTRYTVILTLTVIRLMRRHLVVILQILYLCGSLVNSTIIISSKDLTNHVVYNSPLLMLEIKNTRSTPNGIVKIIVKNGWNIPKQMTVCIVLHVECLVLLGLTKGLIVRFQKGSQVLNGKWFKVHM